MTASLSTKVGYPTVPRISLIGDDGSEVGTDLDAVDRSDDRDDGHVDDAGGDVSDDVRRSNDGSAHHGRTRKHSSYRKAVSNKDNTNLLHPRHAEYGFKKREVRSSVDWTENATSGEHLWVDTSVSGDFCYVGETDCTKVGQRKKCACCRIVLHTGCMARLEQIRFRCKPSFREASHRTYRENTIMRHHWVHRRRQDGKCKHCGKSFQQRFFQCKEIIAISCSWCKAAYHNKISCFMLQQIEEPCTLGVHTDVIIPPSWIIKLPQKGSFKSSIRRRRKASVKKRDSGGSGSSGSGGAPSGGEAATTGGGTGGGLTVPGPAGDGSSSPVSGPTSSSHRPFIVKPIPSQHAKPVLVFINPKSGGNQGAKLLHKFYWLLNPRQVFDLSQGGPRMALEMFRKVPNLRILACGGDGTVGWILSTIDSLNIQPAPPVAILPLGTGNDLARTLNWGGGYTDEPISKILRCVEEGPVVQVDRWNLQTSPLPTAAHDSCTDNELSASDDPGSVAILPLDVMNNYFSIGADAHVTLVFHESREANPEKFNSRFKNKMFYAGAGGKDLLKRSWKDLAEHIKVECDGQDFTAKVKDFKFHCLLFLNIPKYAAGTTPWGNPNSNMTNFEPQRHDDGYLEVIGFTTASLAGLQIGAHGGVRLTQCRSARLETSKAIPVQVDGEPCRLLPSVVEINRRNQANMIQKPKQRGSAAVVMHECPSLPSGRLSIHVHCISMGDYESLHYDKDRLRQAAVSIGVIEVDSDSDLQTTRNHINQCIQSSPRLPNNTLSPAQSDNWCYVDSTTAERFFRIDRALEQVHYITDISSQDLYIVDPDLNASFLTPPIVCAADLAPAGPDAVQPQTVVAFTPDSPWPATFSPPPASSLVVTNGPDDGGGGAVERDPSRSGRHFFGNCTEVESPTVRNGTSSTNCSDAEYNVDDECLSPAETLLHAACKSGDLEKLLQVHRTGVDLLSTDDRGLTALHHAAAFGHKRIVKYIVEKAPAVILNTIDNGLSQTALHKAAWNRRRDVCTLLIASGASITKTDYQGNTPRSLALKAGDRDLADYLEACEKLQQNVGERAYETTV